MCPECIGLHALCLALLHFLTRAHTYTLSLSSLLAFPPSPVSLLYISSLGGARARSLIRRHEFYYYDAKKRARWIFNFRQQQKAKREARGKLGDAEQDGDEEEITLEEAMAELEEQAFTESGIYKFDVLITSFEVFMQVCGGLETPDEGMGIRNEQGNEETTE